MSTANASRCTGCGVTAEHLSSEDYCLDCEHVQIATDMYAVEVALELVESTVRAALERSYAHPDDLLACVGRVIREQDTRARSSEDLAHANRRNMAARMRADGIA